MSQLKALARDFRSADRSHQEACVRLEAANAELSAAANAERDARTVRSEAHAALDVEALHPR